MGKNKKKKKLKSGSASGGDLEAEVQRLRRENEALRARLEKILELASDLPVDEEEEDAQGRDSSESELDVNPS